MRLIIHIVALSIILPAVAYAGPAAECNKRACDLDRDGTGSRPGDYLAFFNSLGSSKSDTAYNSRADFDGDGAVTSEDYSVLLKFCPLGQ